MSMVSTTLPISAYMSRWTHVLSFCFIAFSSHKSIDNTPWYTSSTSSSQLSCSLWCPITSCYCTAVSTSGQERLWRNWSAMDGLKDPLDQLLECSIMPDRLTPCPCPVGKHLAQFSSRTSITSRADDNETVLGKSKCIIKKTMVITLLLGSHCIPDGYHKEGRDSVVVKKRHYLDCPQLDFMMQHLEQCLGSRLLSTKPEDTHIIDFILNILPRSEDALQQGHWRRTWPGLLNTLRDIDIASHPEAEFEEETPARFRSH